MTAQETGLNLRRRAAPTQTKADPMKLTLHVGTKNWSSWSLRGWLIVKLTGLPFEERNIRLRRPDTKAQAMAVSPSGLVPLLQVEDGAERFDVWDSLAIAEFMAEAAPAARLWPAGRAERAQARSVAAEMHGGFMDLRRDLPMDFARSLEVEPGEGARAAIDRIRDLWTGRVTASGGPFLFGASFGAADAFYAPVVSRFRTYGVALEGPARAYADAVWAHPFMQEWRAAAEAEIARGEA